MKRWAWYGSVAATILLAGIALKAVLATPVPTDTQTDPSPANSLELRITAKDKTGVMGEPMGLQIHLRNRGQAPVSLVLPGDGSECAWRTPVVGWSVIPAANADTDRHPDTPPLYRGGRCGNVNPLRKDEVFILGPGQSKTLDGWAGYPNFGGPGTYQVVFYYTNEPNMPIRGVPLGNHANEAVEQIRKSFKVALRSNELTIEVKAK